MIRRFVGIALPIVLATALATGQSTGRSDATFREIVSGQSHQHPIRAAAGDVVDGTFDVRAVAVRISVRDPKDEEVRSFYFFGPNPEQRRIGFVADTAGQYRIEVSAYDRFDSGPQTDLGAPVPIRGAARGAYALRLEARSVASRMTGIAPARDGMPRSARLQRLALDLAGGRRQALDEFWRERANKGPLVERLDGDERHELVTFLWRERYDTRNVFLSWEMASDRETTSFMKQLPGTDVWYVALRLRRGSRFTYLLSPNHLPADAVLTTRRDPLNVRVEPEDPTYPYERASVLDMPGAPDEQWSRRMPSRRGVVEQKRFASNVMKNERDIWVYTPPGYTKTAGPYPLVVFFDGPAYVSRGASTRREPSTTWSGTERSRRRSSASSRPSTVRLNKVGPWQRSTGRRL